MIHKKHLEKQISDEIINDLFSIFINSKTKEDFIEKIEKEAYKNPETLWEIFYPKYDNYRQENLEKNK